MIFRTVSTDPDHDEQAEDALFYRDTLQELVHVGTTLARLLQTQAIADAQAAVQGRAPSTPLADHAATFDRISRAVRRTITLARSLNEPVAPARTPAQPRADARKPTLPEAGQDAAGHPAAAAGRDDAEAPCTGLRDRPEAPDRDPLDRDRPERPDRDVLDRDEDDTGRPPAAVIAGIRRDLGLDTPPGANGWTQRTPADCTPADIEPLCARTAAPSSAAASSARQPGPGLQTSWPQGPWLNAAQPFPDPQPDKREPDQPAAACTQPRPVHPGNASPDDLVEAVAFTLRHSAEADARRRPPPTS